jgi:hypothetical protein
VTLSLTESETKVEKPPEGLGQDRGISPPDRLGGSMLAEVWDAGHSCRPVRYACPEDLTAWMGAERGQKEPVHIVSEGTNLPADLKQGSPAYAHSGGM